MSRRERRVAARGSQSPAELYQAGLHHMQAGRHLDAQICCKQALAADPDHADSLHLMGILCHQMQQYDHALEWISRAIRQNPRPRYLSSLGSTLQSLGRREEALRAFDKAVQLKPDDADLWVNLGNILIELERPIDAVLSFQHALTLNPRHWDAANKSGFLFYGLKDFEAALTQFDLCDRLQPNQALTLQARALAFRGLRRFEQSLADNLRSYEIDPDIIETRNNIGDALRSLEHHQEALQWFDKALELQPNHIGALNNKAFLLGQMHRFDEAFAMYDRMKALNLSNPATDWNLGLLHMMTGNFEAGWIGREARWNTPDVLPAAYPKFAEPMWLGKEQIDGKTILIRIDEGLGDSIQFARYVPMVAARGARIILVVAEAVRPLLSKLPGVSQCLPVTTETLPAFDMHCPMCSLPLAFGTRLDTIPSDVSYLPAPDADLVQAWEERLGPRKKLRVGLVWSGNPKHGNDHNRSIPLRALAGILDADATFVSLQKDPRADDQAVLREQSDILDLTADLTDFVATAALIRCLDLVITVDTSVAHLAGALGCPTWILLPYVPDYRWLLDRDDSPWYPTVRLFRQTETREYPSVLERVRCELLKLTAAG